MLCQPVTSQTQSSPHPSRLEGSQPISLGPPRGRQMASQPTLVIYYSWFHDNPCFQPTFFCHLDRKPQLLPFCHPQQQACAESEHIQGDRSCSGYTWNKPHVGMPTCPDATTHMQPWERSRASALVVLLLGSNPDSTHIY